MAYWHTTCQPEVGQAFVCCCNSVFVYCVVSFCLLVFLFFLACLHFCLLVGWRPNLVHWQNQSKRIWSLDDHLCVLYVSVVCVSVFCRCHFFVIVSKFRTSVLAAAGDEFMFSRGCGWFSYKKMESAKSLMRNWKNLLSYWLKIGRTIKKQGLFGFIRSCLLYSIGSTQPEQ